MSKESVSSDTSDTSFFCQPSKMNARNVQTVMIVWDINLINIPHCIKQIDIYTPSFSLNPNKSENTNWIRVKKDMEKISIKSNFSYLKELKSCTTYMINHKKNEILEVYKDFKQFPWNQNGWKGETGFVFEIEMYCDSTDAQRPIWKHFITTAKERFNMKRLTINNKYNEMYTVYNDSGHSCVVQMNKFFDTYNLFVGPEKLLCGRKDDSNFLLLLGTTDFIRQYHGFHFTANTGSVRNIQSTPKMKPDCITDIYELDVTVENVSGFKMATISRLIKANMTSSISPTETFAYTSNEIDQHSHSHPEADKRELQYRLNLTSNLKEYFAANKLCDISLHVQDKQIRAHKIALSSGSTIWRDLIAKDEKLDSIHITDFEYETIKEMIEFMYTGNVKLATDQLLVAAVKYGVDCLKKLCEKQLIETIKMENVVNLVVLADNYKAIELYYKAIEFIVKNRKAFSESEEATRFFNMCPELAFTIFIKIAMS